MTQCVLLVPCSPACVDRKDLHSHSFLPEAWSLPRYRRQWEQTGAPAGRGPPCCRPCCLPLNAKAHTQAPKPFSLGEKSPQPCLWEVLLLYQGLCHRAEANSPPISTQKPRCVPGGFAVSLCVGGGACESGHSGLQSKFSLHRPARVLQNQSLQVTSLLIGHVGSRVPRTGLQGGPRSAPCDRALLAGEPWAPVRCGYHKAISSMARKAGP